MKLFLTQGIILERGRKRERQRMRASKFYSKEVYTKREEEEEDLPAYP